MRIAATLIAVAALPAAAVPVDLRVLHDPAPARAESASAVDSIPLNDGPYFPGCEIMATRQVINELLALGEVLQNEAWNLDHDALELWTQWQAYAPVPANAPSEEMRRSEVFGLHGQARALNERASALMSRLQKVDAEWWRHWKALDAAAKAGRDGRELKERLDKFKGRLEATAAESNAVDAALRQAHGQYDFVRPLAVEHMTSRRKEAPVLRQPWHWNYVLSGRPRPDMRYDYAVRYDHHYEESHDWLRTKGLVR